MTRVSISKRPLRGLVLAGVVAVLVSCAGPRTEPPAPGEPSPPPVSGEPRDLDRLHADAEAAVARGDSATAASRLEEADRRRPDHPRTLYLRGRWAESRGRGEAALDFYRRAWLADDAKPHGDALVGAFLARAQAHYRAGELDSALAAVEAAGKVDEDAPLDRFLGLIAYARAERSEGDERAARLREAEGHFLRELERSPEDADAAQDLGSVLLAAGRYDDAVALYRGLLAKQPREGGLYLALARAHSLSGGSGLAQAEEAAGRALRSGEPVDDPASWAASGSRRFPESEMTRTLAALGPPEEIRTYTVPGGGLVEAWFYWKRSGVEVFRDGARVGERIVLPAD